MRRLILMILVLIVFGLTLAMVLVNLGDVRVSYLFGSTSMPLSVALVVALVFGVVLGVLCIFPAVFKARVRARRAQGRLDALEKEVHNLRHAPLRDAP
ncbi:MAG: lipopolysaccharide assembly protein LapA domain-containing protein [Gammaproteobacteria bacterium]